MRHGVCVSTFDLLCMKAVGGIYMCPLPLTPVASAFLFVAAAVLPASANLTLWHKHTGVAVA